MRSPWRWRRSLPAAAFPPYPYFGDARSSILGDPTTRRLPEMPSDRLETASEASGLGGRSPARQTLCPLIPKPTTPLEQMRAPVRCLDLVLDHMRQRRLDDLSEMIGLVVGPAVRYDDVKPLRRGPRSTASGRHGAAVLEDRLPVAGGERQRATSCVPPEPSKRPFASRPYAVVPVLSARCGKDRRHPQGLSRSCWRARACPSTS